MTFNEKVFARASARDEARPAPGDAIAPIERLPKWLLCIPIGAQILWLGLKYRSITLPSVLNPAIENGGLVGESKSSYLHGVAGEFAHLIAKTVVITPGEDI